MSSSISSPCLGLLTAQNPSQTHFRGCGNHCGRHTEMRLTLPRGNAAVLTLLHHSHCGSAPSPCPTQAGSLLRHICSVSPSISQPCRTRWQRHTALPRTAPGTHLPGDLCAPPSLCPVLRCAPLS